MTRTLTSEDLQGFEERLRALYDRLSGELAQREDDYLTDASGTREKEREPVDAHTEDVGVEIVEQEGATVRDVVDALDRIQRGEFGRCVDCGGAIARGRLRAIPYAARCVGCASQET